MSTTAVARRYARALYEEAEAAGRSEAVDAGMEAVRATLDGSRELRQLFASPTVPPDRKRAVLDRLFGGRVDPLIVRLMHLLVAKGREAAFPDVVRAYERYRDERHGRAEAHVRTALPLSEADTEALRSALEQATGRRVRLRVDVEPELLGGLVVRVGDTVYDGSVRHQLDELRRRFARRVYLSTN